MDAKTLSGILGHTNASFTLDTYTEAEGTDRGDEGRDCGAETAESGGISAAAGAGERQEERQEESEEGERPQVKRITSMCAE